MPTFLFHSRTEKESGLGLDRLTSTELFHKINMGPNSVLTLSQYKMQFTIFVCAGVRLMLLLLLLRLKKMFASSLDELCLIDAGINDLSKLPLGDHLRVLNLHANHIERIQNISQARSLVHLDLSSNRIRTLENLSPLVRLRTLNLSCNCIRQVSGLGGLRSLVSLDLSYNELQKLDGFLEMRGPQYQLKTVKLHGNQIASVNELSQCLSECQSLRTLTVSNGSDAGSNPLCRDADYVAKLFTNLPRLAWLDGKDAQGQLAESDVDLADVPGLESYDEFLTMAASLPKPVVVTPKVDAALDAYHRGKIATSSDLDSTVVGSVAAKSDPEKGKNYSDRLHLVERQLSNLLRRRGAQMRDGRMAEKSSSDDNILPTTRAVADFTDDSGDDRLLQASARKVQTSSKPAAKLTTSRSDLGLRRPVRRVERQAHSSAKYQVTVPQNSASADKRMRDDLRATYVQLMKELEGERERRTAAEQAAKRVTEQLGDVMQKAAEDHESQQTSLETAVRLKRALVAEKESHKKTQATVDVLREKAEELQKTVDEKERAAENAQKTAKLNHDAAAKAEQDYFHQIAELKRQTHESQIAAAATARELELVKVENRNEKEQVRQLQTLLADREKAHQQELAGKHSLSSQAVDDLVAKALAKAERDRLREEHAQSKKYNDLAKKYSELEDEFRMALQIELDRFKELQVRRYCQIHSESNKCSRVIVTVDG